MEIWNGLKYNNSDYSDYYEVSSFGNVRNFKTKKQRKLYIRKDGRYSLNITINGYRRTILIHRAVAITFIKNIKNKPSINHIDGNKLNNNMENLEWCTAKENADHAVNNGLIKSGYNSKNSKLKKEDVDFIINNYKKRDKNFSLRALAKMFNVSHVTILCVINHTYYN